MLVTINLDTTRDALVRVHPAGTQTVIGTVPTSFGLALSGGQVYLAGAGGVVWKLPTIPVASSTAALPLVFAFDTMSAIFGATSPLASNCALRTPTANPDNADTTGSAVTVQPLANDIPGDPAAPLDAATLRLLPPSEAPPPWWSSPVKAHSPSI